MVLLIVLIRVSDACGVPSEAIGLVKELLEVTGLCEKAHHWEFLSSIEFVFEDFEELEREVFPKFVILKLNLVHNELINYFLLL